LAQIPVIVVSGGDVNTFKKRALESGAQAYLEKPVNEHRTINIISGLIGESADDAARGIESSARRLAESNT
jgi:FixJ family two-component response regulator